MAAWTPQTFNEICKHNAGRRKLHRRKREARANRVLRILASMDSAGLTQLLDTTCGLVSAASVELEVSKATASRDFALVRRVHRQFGRMFGRSFDPKREKIFWIWDWSHYGFMTAESTKAGYHQPVGHFPFDTRKQETEESYLRLYSVVLAQQQIDLTVEHARLDQGAHADLKKKAGQAMIIPGAGSAQCAGWRAKHLRRVASSHYVCVTAQTHRMCNAIKAVRFLFAQTETSKKRRSVKALFVSEYKFVVFQSASLSAKCINL